MENIFTIIGQIVLIVAVGVLLVFINFLWFGAISSINIPIVYRIFPMQNLKPRFRIHLQKNLGFYNRLSPKSRLKFERRVQQFINMKKFIPRSKDLVITDEMIALIAGTAIMVTYGFPQVYLSHFSRILIYSDNYYSTITRQYHKGEVNPRGIIVLSWVSLKEGYNDRHDGINLGIHEIAHALKIENRIRNEEFGFFDPRALKRFDELAESNIDNRLNGNGEEDILRVYSITNRQEYFAVATELFFENPERLSCANPDLYILLVRLLRVDPLNI